ncbi:MAG: SHOCT domain-containing protein [Streptosporangiaceae bacterium]
MPLRRRPLLRAAAVGGGAYVMGKRSAQRSAMDQGQDERISQLEADQSAQSQMAPAQTSPDAAQGSMLDDLGRLTAMHDKGALSDEEFAQAKAKLLSG